MQMEANTIKSIWRRNGEQIVAAEFVTPGWALGGPAHGILDIIQKNKVIFSRTRYYSAEHSFSVASFLWKFLSGVRKKQVFGILPGFFQTLSESCE